MTLYLGREMDGHMIKTYEHVQDGEFYRSMEEQHQGARSNY